ncbi:ABC transporter ATP-binding protein [Fodinicola feengrottensis]|uniref:ABC transporter ATP-binding protein n=1 Tax=Fodinicola feengrottensis TaxID=435914 RepID=A0ABN2GUI4_9ACTN|nr:ABC transporter ATP-binding protein [Fodinicola feengrottensis]
MPATVPLLELRGVAVGYAERLVLQDIDLAVPAGSVTAILGANGSGKSTLLRTAARLHKLAAGSIRVGGTELSELSAGALARRLAFLPQSALVPPGVSVRELVGYGRTPHQGLLGRASGTDREAVDEALARTRLSDLADRTVDALSGGERQRAWIAMALAQRTDVLLLDEPTTFLDLRHQSEVLDLLHDLAADAGKAVVAVLHDLNHAAAVADQVVLVGDGRLIAAGRPAEVITTEHIRAGYRLEVAVDTDPETGTPVCRPYRLNHY